MRPIVDTPACRSAGKNCCQAMNQAIEDVTRYTTQSGRMGHEDRGAAHVHSRNWQGDDQLYDDDSTDRQDFLQRQFCCPYCWETVEPPLEGDLEGELVWDCEVCCRPWLITIHTEMDGTKSVTVDRAQG